jgi:putative tryptophan/tyrosine transport system substrate-binding protein
MRRRAFIASLAATAAWPFVTRAQERIPRIGWLPPALQEADKPMLEAFMAGLSELGYVPGKTIVIEPRFSNGEEAALAAAARELVDRKVDVIVTGGPGLFAAHKATDTVPIVFGVYGAIDERISMGIVASLAHPGGNVTGETFLLDGLFLKRIELLKQVKPAMTRLGLLSLQGSVFNQFMPPLEAKIRALGLTPVPIELANLDDCDRALSSDPGRAIDTLLVPEETTFTMGPGPAAIAAAAERHGVPAAGPITFAANGGLFSNGVDFRAMTRRAATFVDKILKGTKPGDIPIEQATKFVTIVNLKTAKTLGLDIPPTLLAGADEVIE